MGSGTGGVIQIFGGASSGASAAGGHVSVTGGAGTSTSGSGGNVLLQGGSSGNTGGNVILRAGGGGAQGGKVQIQDSTGADVLRMTPSGSIEVYAQLSIMSPSLVYAAAGVKWGTGGSTVTKIMSFSFDINVASLAGGYEQDSAVSASGVQAGDIVMIGPAATSSVQSGMQWCAYAYSGGFTVRISNIGSNTMSSSGTWYALVWQAN